MVNISLLCYKCNSKVEVNVGQSVHWGKLFWYRSYRCSNCGNTIEEDGMDDTPEEIRNAIILQEGEYRITVRKDIENVQSLLLKLKKILNLNLNKTKELRKLIPGTILKGTKAEMERIKMLVNSDRVSVEKI